MVRPEKKQQGSYECPSNYEPCNPEFFGRPNGYQYVVCYKKDANEKQSVCPITDIKFDEQNKDPSASYKNADSQSNSSNKSLFLSFDFMQHGIQQITVAPKAPCRDKARYNAASNQQFWFAEMRHPQRGCYDSKSFYQELKSNESLTEWDLHLENGVLTRLDDTMHTSYSFFPSSAIKKEVPIKFFQRPQVNFKIECATDPTKSYEALQQAFVVEPGALPDLLDEVDKLALASLLLVLIAPTTSMTCTVVVTPLTFIVLGGFYISLTLHIDDALVSLKEIETGIQFPIWLDDCFDSPVTDSINIERSFVLIDELRDEMDFMRTLMFRFLISLAVLFGLPIVLSLLYCCLLAMDNLVGDYNWSEDASHFLNAYFKFN